MKFNGQHILLSTLILLSPLLVADNLKEGINRCIDKANATQSINNMMIDNCLKSIEVSPEQKCVGKWIMPYRKLNECRKSGIQCLTQCKTNKSCFDNCANNLYKCYEHVMDCKSPP